MINVDLDKLFKQKSYIPYRKEICQNWTGVPVARLAFLFQFTLLGGNNKHDDFHKWLNQNITGYWTFLNSGSAIANTLPKHKTSLNEMLFLFEKEEEALAFKLTWS